MRKFVLRSALTMLCVAVDWQAVRAQAVPFDADRWQIKDKEARLAEHFGRPSLFLKSGYAFLKEVDFENGVIEVDIAAPVRRSFIGLVFRATNEDEHEIVWFRPHKSGLDDAVQYAPSFNGMTPWQLYNGKGFTSAVEIPKEQWLHVRPEINGLGGKVYFNNADEPALVIEELKRGQRRGALGLWADVNGGYFSKFSYRLEPAVVTGERKPAPLSAGYLTRWELSEAFDCAAQDPEKLPSPDALKTLKWQPVGVEPPGMVVIDRYRRGPGIVQFFADPADRVGERAGRKVVFARTAIESDRDPRVKLSLGYSDEVTVFLNAQPVFTGRSAFRFRDPGFLGIMNVENDTVYLNLKKGRNELVLAVAEYFGGWGFICRLDETQGITFR